MAVGKGEDKMTKTFKCEICEESYTIYSYYFGDEYDCPYCEQKGARSHGEPPGKCHNCGVKLC